MKIVVCGHGRHGKDTVCEYIRDRYRFSFVSSSWFLTEPVIWPVLGDLYNSLQECFDDRHNHRDVWYNLIAEYNQLDHARLGVEIFAEHDIYCGLRNIRELTALRNRVDCTVVWVDRSAILEPEPNTSITISDADADYVLDNNRTLSHLYDQIDNLMHLLGTS
jgi:dephospho-CoA kinase